MGQQVLIRVLKRIMTYHLVSNKSNTMVTMYVEGMRLPEHLSSLLVFSWVRVARSLVFYVL
jgi:hypothetical protein